MAHEMITGIITPFVKGLQLPTDDNHAANKIYVDTAINNLSVIGVAAYDGGDFTNLNNGILDGGSFV
jgi:hypothetical protein